MISSFRQDGTVLTTVTHTDGKVETATENYRIVVQHLSSTTRLCHQFEVQDGWRHADTGQWSSSIVMQRVGG